MRKLFLIVLTIMLFIPPAQARDEQRKISSSNLSTSQSLTTVASTLYDVIVVAQAAGAYAVVFDSDGVSPLSGKTELVELHIAAQFNTQHINLGDYGIKAHEGLYVYVNNATVIIHYR